LQKRYQQITDKNYRNPHTYLEQRLHLLADLLLLHHYRLLGLADMFAGPRLAQVEVLNVLNAGQRHGVARIVFRGEFRKLCNDKKDCGKAVCSKEKLKFD
jgi:hypothetical protein